MTVAAASRAAAGVSFDSRAVSRVLIVSYVFPPAGGAGVQRVTKFVKYLPQWGWRPSVLVCSNPSVPVHDLRLASDIPHGTPIGRARTLEPSYSVKEAISAGATVRQDGLRRRVRRALGHAAATILQPDPQVLWFPAAVSEGRRLLAAAPHTAILATGPPFSSFLIGQTLARVSGLPLILDYRDEWTLSHQVLENRRPGALTGRLQSAMERSVMRSASAVVATTRSSAAMLKRAGDQGGNRPRVCCIPNGYDSDDFLDRTEARRDVSRLRIVYGGTLWSLTSVEPLVHAIRRVVEREPNVADSLEVVFVGRRTGEQERFVQDLRALPVHVIDHPYLDHDAALGLVRSADLLCVLLSDCPGAERVLPAKVFECMASGRPILAVAPIGELWDVLTGYPSAHRFVPADTSGIAALLARFVADRRRRRTALPPAQWHDRRFDRRWQAYELASLLNAVVGNTRPAMVPLPA